MEPSFMRRKRRQESSNDSGCIMQIGGEEKPSRHLENLLHVVLAVDHCFQSGLKCSKSDRSHRSETESRKVEVEAPFPKDCSRTGFK